MTDSRGPIIRDTAPFFLSTEHLSFLVLLLSLSLFRRASLSEITSRVPNRKIIMPRLTRYHRTVANNSNPLCPDVRSLSLPGVPANQRWITDNSKKGKKGRRRGRRSRETRGNREEDEEWYFLNVPVRGLGTSSFRRTGRHKMTNKKKKKKRNENRIGTTKCRSTLVDARGWDHDINYLQITQRPREQIVRCLISWPRQMFQKHWRRKDFANCPNTPAKPATFHVSI